MRGPTYPVFGVANLRSSAFGINQELQRPLVYPFTRTLPHAGPGDVDRYGCLSGDFRVNISADNTEVADGDKVSNMLSSVDMSVTAIRAFRMSLITGRGLGAILLLPSPSTLSLLSLCVTVI